MFKPNQECPHDLSSLPRCRATRCVYVCRTDGRQHGHHGGAGERRRTTSSRSERLHSSMMQGVRGEEKRPGEFRQKPVWIGSPTDTPENAIFVPPFQREMEDAWRDWEEFASSDPRLPKLVQCA